MTTRLELPKPRYPMVTRVVSELPTPVEGVVTTGPITWMIKAKHPFMVDLMVVRMFVDELGVEIYSIPEDGKNGVRHTIPMEKIRCIEEVMPAATFLDEIEMAQEDDEDEDDGPEIVDQAPEEESNQPATSP